MSSTVPPRTVAVAGLVSLAAVLASCSEQEDAAPTPPPSLAPTTVESTVVESTTTIVPTTTAAPETTTTTTIAPTTTAPEVPVGEPTGASTPIFVGSAADAWLYLGRWTGSGWERAFDDGGAPIRYELAEGIGVSISELGQTPVSGTAGPAGEACFDESTGAIEGPIITPNAGVPDEPGFGYRAVGFPAAWDIDPREAVVIDEQIQAYADAGLAAFVDTGVETQVGEIDQTVVTDLDGDGDTEVLVVYGHENARVEGQSDPVGGYSALLLIDADTQQATEIAKSFTPVAAEGEAVQPFDTYRVLDVADLNGDGISEVLVHTWFTGGASVSAYTYDGTTLTEVLTAGCGT